MQAETVITALAEYGLISIQGSDLYAHQELIFGSQGGIARITESTLSTPSTSIHVGVRASIQAEGSGHIRQNADGSISIHA
jgi:hypothetical protein